MSEQPKNLKTQEYADFLARNRDAERWSEDAVLLSLVKSPSPLILDVGAYTGTSAIRFRHIFPNCRLMCFEPNPAARQELLLTKARLGGDIQVFDWAISDHDGSANFVVQGINPGMSGLARRNVNSKDSIALASDGPSSQADLNVEELVVPTRRLDSVEMNGAQHVDVLKIDVQSCESKVLDGASRILFSTEVVIVEVSFYDMYETRSSFLAVERSMEPAGLRLWAITTHSRNPMNGRTDWVNAVYSRN